VFCTMMQDSVLCVRGVQLSAKDMIGDSAIKTTKRGGPALD